MKNLNEFKADEAAKTFISLLEKEDLILEYDSKDEKRIKDLFTRGKGEESKILQLAQAMAKSIKKADKAFARGEAAEFILGKKGERNPNAISAIFYSRAQELGMDIDAAKLTSGEIEGDNILDIDIDSGKQGGQIFLPSYSSLNIWENEITGQLSDGAWENSKPYDHWEFWSKLTPTIGKPEVKAVNMRPKKTGYNLASLIEYVGDRMISVGRMGKAINKLMDYNQRIVAEKLGESNIKDMEAYNAKVESKQWPFKHSKYVGVFSNTELEKYFSTSYDLEDMKKDLKIIKLAMKNVNVVYK